MQAPLKLLKKEPGYTISSTSMQRSPSLWQKLPPLRQPTIGKFGRHRSQADNRLDIMQAPLKLPKKEPG